MVVPLLFLACTRIIAFLWCHWLTTATGQISSEDSVCKCHGMFPSSHELQKSRGGYFHQSRRPLDCVKWLDQLHRHIALSRSLSLPVCHFPASLPLDWYWPFICYLVVILLEVSVCMRAKNSKGNCKFSTFAWSFHAPPFRSLPHYVLLQLLSRKITFTSQNKLHTLS